jgi:hypothetical protein
MCLNDNGDEMLSLMGLLVMVEFDVKFLRKIDDIRQVSNFLIKQRIAIALLKIQK